MRREIGKIIIGQEKVLDELLMAVFCRGHALLVGVPGLAAETFQALGRWEDAIMIGEAHVDAPSLPAGERALLCSVLAQAFRRKGLKHRDELAPFVE